MAVEREQRIKEDTSIAKRNLYCEVVPIHLLCLTLCVCKERSCLVDLHQ